MHVSNQVNWFISWMIDITINGEFFIMMDLDM